MELMPRESSQGVLLKVLTLLTLAPAYCEVLGDEVTRCTTQAAIPNATNLQHRQSSLYRDFRHYNIPASTVKTTIEVLVVFAGFLVLSHVTKLSSPPPDDPDPSSKTSLPKKASPIRRDDRREAPSHEAHPRGGAPKKHQWRYIEAFLNSDHKGSILTDFTQLCYLLQAYTAAAPERMVKDLLEYLSGCSADDAAESADHIARAMSRISAPEVLEAFVSEARGRLGVGINTLAAREALIGCHTRYGNIQQAQELLELSRSDYGKGTCTSEQLLRHHCSLIRALLKTGEVVRAHQQLLEIQNDGIQVPPEALTELVKAAEASGLLPIILDKITQHDTPLSSESLPILVGAAADRKDEAALRQLGAQMKEQQIVLPPESYEALLLQCGRTTSMLGLEIFEEMLQLGLNPSAPTCHNTLESCAESGNHRLAEAVMEHMRMHHLVTLDCYKSMAQVYFIAGLLDKACELYHMMREDGLEPDSVIYTTLMRCAVKAERFDLSQQLQEESIEHGWDDRHISWMMRAAGREGKPQKALDLLRQLEAEAAPGFPHEVVYNSTLEALAHCGDMVAAEALFEEIPAKCGMSVTSINAMIKGHCALGSTRRAWEHFQRIEEFGLSPDAGTFNGLLTHFASVMDDSTTWRVLQMMQKQGVKANRYTCAILLKMVRKTKDSIDRERIMTWFDNCDVDACQDDVLFATVIDACIGSKDTARLTQVLKSFNGSKLKPTVRIYGCLIRASGALHRVSACRSLWKEMTETRCLLPNDHALFAMIDALIDSRQIQEALDLFEEWKSRISPTVSTYLSLIKAFAAAGDSEKVRDFFAELRQKRLPLNQIAYSSIIDAYARAGCMAEACSLLDEMVKVGLAPNLITYSNLIKGFCFKGELMEAWQYFREMLDRGIAADSVVLNLLLDGCVRHSQWDMADRLIADMPGYKVVPSTFTVSILVRMWGKRRNLEKAFQVVAEALKSGVTLDPLIGTCLVGSCLQNRSIESALEAYEAMKTWPDFDGPDRKCYGSLVSALIRSNRVNHALTILKQACQRHGQLRRGASKAAKMLLPLVTAEVVTPLIKALRSRGLLTEVTPSIIHDLREAGVSFEESWFEQEDWSMNFVQSL